MPDKTNDSTIAFKAMSAIIFVIFTVAYIYSYQGDVLAMTQYAWAHGQTHYDRLVGVCIITTVLSMVAFVVGFFLSLPQRAHALIYFPSFLLMGLLTAVDVENGTVHTSALWLTVSPLILLLYVVVVVQLKRYQPFLMPLRSTGFLSQPWWTNILLLCAMMTLTYSMGNTDRTLHTRLAVERHIHQCQWDDALNTGFAQYDNDSSLTMMRAMALARTGQLPHRLFNYEITGGSRSLLPQPDHSTAFLIGTASRLWATLGRVPRHAEETPAAFLQRELRRGTLTSAGKDYLLCAYLLDKDLADFVAVLPRYYTINDSLPTHYQEAYVLYCERNHKPNALAADAISTDYNDFLALMRTPQSAARRAALLRKNYFGTYWYYYYCNKPKRKTP